MGVLPRETLFLFNILSCTNEFYSLAESNTRSMKGCRDGKLSPNTGIEKFKYEIKSRNNKLFG